MPNLRSRSHVLHRVTFLAWWRTISDLMSEYGLPPLTYGKAQALWWKLKLESKRQDQENKLNDKEDDHG